MPHRAADGVIGWVRVDEPCRMCGGTGKEHDPLPYGARAVPRPS
ncbi:hypothetical protein [Actinocorallia sp. A-T 12471]|nr:hypothetical protein [Actinocorallia sp. A-T 12471]MDX6741880.1 hypothetical protein [Actinocorallia sp. A-T 12471]